MVLSILSFGLVVWLTGSYGLLSLPRVKREDETAYCWPRKRSKFKIGSMVSTERMVWFHTIAKSKNQKLKDPF